MRAAGLALLKGCDFVIAGVKYGITEGMDREIHTANMLGIAVIDANQIKRHLEYEEKRQERATSDYAKLHSCEQGQQIIQLHGLRLQRAVQTGL